MAFNYHRLHAPSKPKTFGTPSVPKQLPPAIAKTNPSTKQYKVDKVTAPALGGFGKPPMTNVKWK